MLDYLVGLINTTSAPQLALAGYLLLVGGWVLYVYLIKELVWPLIKIKYFELLIFYHSDLLKKSSDSNEVLALTEVLQKLFQVYEREKKPPVSMERLFPKSNLLNSIEITKYEQKMKVRINFYYKMYQNIQRYNDNDYGRSITISELIRRME